MRHEPSHALSSDAQIDLVVVNYKTPRDLDAFLLSLLFNASGKDARRVASVTIVNVDPGPDDRKVAVYSSAPLSTPGCTVTMINMPWNCGYGIACNRGAREGSADVIAFFNADTQLRSGVIDGCVRAFVDNPRWGIVGPKQVNNDNQITHAGIFGPNDRPRLRGWMKKGHEFNDIRDDCYSVSGSAYFIRRSLWDTLRSCPLFIESRNAITGEHEHGAFLPTPHYYEETYLSVHARHHGWKIAYLGNLEMIHNWHRASPVGGRTEQKLLPQSREMFRDACRHHEMIHD